MPYIQSTQTDKRKTLYQEKITKEKKDPHEVRQDGRAPGLKGVASLYAARADKVVRAHRLDKENKRVKKRSTSRQTEQWTVWLTRPISLKVKRVASDMHLTRSRAIRYLVEYALDNKTFDNNLKAILDVIREGNVKETRRNQKPYRDNSYRAAYYSAQDRTLLTNILNLLLRLLQEPPDTMQRILKKSEQDARDSLAFLSPDIADIIRQREPDIDNQRNDGKGEG